MNGVTHKSFEFKDLLKSLGEKLSFFNEDDEATNQYVEPLVDLYVEIEDKND